MLKLEKINNRHLLHLEPLQKEHIPEIRALWNRQYESIVENYDFLPKKWLDDTTLFSHFIEQHLDGRHSIVVRLPEKIVGFLTYDLFDFHNEPTAFFPIMAHAAEAAYKLNVYSMMYAYVSQKLVEQGCLNHLFAFFAPDQALQAYLFELGFGLYVVDAYRGLHQIPIEGQDYDIVVRKAGLNDMDELLGLVQESAQYYAEAPLFLKRDSEEKEQIVELLISDEAAVFVAVRNDEMIGFMNVRCNQTDEVITLSDTTTTCIDPLGAYLKKAYRGLGVGKKLLGAVIEWSNQQDITNLHVDFESANYHANQFWLNYFTPVLYSVKRRLNNDLP